MAESFKDIPILDVDYHLREYGEVDVLRARVKQLESGPGGIMEMKQTISDKEQEIERLKEKCNMQATILQRITPESHPGVYFIHAELGEKDHNGMPEKFLVVPAYGCDFSYVYERTNETTGPQW